MPRPARVESKDLKRVQMDMPPRSLERLKALQVKTEAASYAEVVRNALQLYEALIEEVDAGKTIYAEKDGAYVRLPVFGA
jgi:hypothetical protein